MAIQCLREFPLTCKLYGDVDLALRSPLFDGMTAGGFGLCGFPESLIDGLLRSGIRGIKAISNNARADDLGLGLSRKRRQIDDVRLSTQTTYIEGVASNAK
jgi:acyl CoA:acetate/3-ketoacid CoA transferase alpha subunit